jgi:hypothetical protein
MNIYRKLAVEGEMDILKTRINALVNPVEDRFSQEKSRINSIISDTLGKKYSKRLHTLVVEEMNHQKSIFPTI